MLDCQIPAQKVGEFDTELVKEFFLGLVRNAGCALHIKQLSGENSHHIIEGIFKSFARAMAIAVKENPDFAGKIPSTKGRI